MRHARCRGTPGRNRTSTTPTGTSTARQLPGKAQLVVPAQRAGDDRDRPVHGGVGCHRSVRAPRDCATRPRTTASSTTTSRCRRPGRSDPVLRALRGTARCRTEATHGRIGLLIESPEVRQAGRGHADGARRRVPRQREPTIRQTLGLDYRGRRRCRTTVHADRRRLCLLPSAPLSLSMSGEPRTTRLCVAT